MHESATATAPAHGSREGRPHHHGHSVPLGMLFMLLLLFTAIEFGMFEVWHRSATTAADGSVHYIIPKLALVMLIFLFTIPKAAIVMVYFMHLKFEKQMIIALAITPLLLAVGAVSADVCDTRALYDRAYNKMHDLYKFSLHAGEEGEGKGAEGATGAPAELSSEKPVPSSRPSEH